MARGNAWSVAALVGAAGVAVAWWQYTGTPEYSLAQLAQAIRAHERLRVEEYLDVRGVSESVVDQVVRAGITSALQSSSGGESPFAGLGAQLGLTLIQGLKPALTSQVETAFWSMVDDSIARANAGVRPGALAVLDKIKLTANYRGIAARERVGARARITLRFARPAPDTGTVLVPVRLEQSGHHWRIVSVELSDKLLGGGGAGWNPERAYLASMRADLRNLLVAEAMFFTESNRYSSDIACTIPPTQGTVRFCLTAGNALGTVTLGPEPQTGWTANVTNANTTMSCALYVGAVTPAPPATVGDPEGTPVCR
jgi:hypothetical protein